MRNQKKKDTACFITWFVSIWIVGLKYLMWKKGLSTRLLFLDISYQNMEDLKNIAMWTGIVLLTSVILYLFAWGIMKVSITIRIGKKIFEIKHRKFIKKKIVIISGIHIVIAACCIVCSLFVDFPEYIRDKYEWKGDVTIAHAGGIIEDFSYTNSPEAIRLNYERGHRTFEIDMVLTSDNKVACIHDWDVPFQEGREVGIAPSSDVFLSYSIREKYTPILFEDLCRIMNEYPDMWLVTDSKYPAGEEIVLEFEEMVNVAKKLNLEHILDRIIVQIYNEDMYEIVMNVYPFRSWIFTLYQRWGGGNIEEFEKIARFCYKNNIQNITMGKARMSSEMNNEIIQISQKYKLDIYTHTVNDMDEAKNNFSLGVKGIYTDSIIPSDLKE